MRKAQKKEIKSNRRRPTYKGIPPSAKSAKDVFRSFCYEPHASPDKALLSAAGEQKGETLREASSNQSDERELLDKPDPDEWERTEVKIIQTPVPSISAEKDATRASCDFTKGTAEECPRAYRATEIKPPIRYEQSVSYVPYAVELRAKRQQAERELHRRERAKFLRHFFLALALVINLETSMLGLVWAFVKTRFGNSNEQINEATTLETQERKPQAATALKEGSLINKRKKRRNSTKKIRKNIR